MHFFHMLIVLFQLGVPVVCALLPDGKVIIYIYLFNVLFATAEQFNKTTRSTIDHHWF